MTYMPFNSSEFEEDVAGLTFHEQATELKDWIDNLYDGDEVRIYLGYDKFNKVTAVELHDRDGDRFVRTRDEDCALVPEALDWLGY